jgi:hypothetical protein
MLWSYNFGSTVQYESYMWCLILLWEILHWDYIDTIFIELQHYLIGLRKRIVSVAEWYFILCLLMAVKRSYTLLNVWWQTIMCSRRHKEWTAGKVLSRNYFTSLLKLRSLCGWLRILWRDSSNQPENRVLCTPCTLSRWRKSVVQSKPAIMSQNVARNIVLCSWSG